MRKGPLYFKSLVAWGFLILLTSCGYISDEPVENADTAFVNELSVNCDVASELDIVKKIFEQDISSSLDCMRSGLNSYATLVKRDNPAFLSREELGTFIADYYQLNKSNLDDKLKLLFDINSLLLNDPQDLMAVGNVDNVFGLLVTVNREAIVLKKIIDGLNDDPSKNILRESRAFGNSLKRLGGELGVYLESSLGNKDGHTLNLNDSIIELLGARSFSRFSIDEKTLNAILSYKKLFIGGDKSILTSQEFLRLLQVGPDLITSVFNLYFADKEQLGGQVGFIGYFQKNLETIQTQLYPHEDTTIITSQSEINLIFEKFFSEINNYDFYLPLIKIIKNSVIDGKGNYREIYSHGNMKSLLSLADIGLESYLFYLNNENFFSRAGNKFNLSSFRQTLSKNDFLLSTNDFAQRLEAKFDKFKILPGQVEYYRLLKFLNQEMDDLKLDPSLVSAVLGVKTLFLGGAREYITQFEIQALIKKFEFLGNIVYDYIDYDASKGVGKDFLYMLMSNLKAIAANIHPNEQSRVTFFSDQILEIATYFNDQIDFKPFLPMIEKVKIKVIGGYKDHFSIRDIVAALKVVETLVEKLYFAELSFPTLTSPGSLKSNTKLKIDDISNSRYSDFSEEKKLRYFGEFNDIMASYRYFRDDKGYSYYGNQVKRNLTGLKEILLIKWAAELLMPIYGEMEDIKNFDGDIIGRELVLTEKKINTVVADFEPILVHFGLWSNNIEIFIRNIVLLADLFQEQSNGTLSVNKAEITEYGSLVFMAMQVGDEMLQKMVNKKYCKNRGTAKNIVISNECFRDYYFETLMIDLKLKDYLVKLYQYIRVSDPKEVTDFLISVEDFSRQNRLDAVDTSVAMRVFGAMLNIESTIIRFDFDQNNILTFSELEEGYKVYASSVLKLAKKAGLPDIPFVIDGLDLGPRIYYYMIEEMKTPEDGWDKLALFKPLPKNVKAKRLNIGKLLDNLIKEANKQAP